MKESYSTLSQAINSLRERGYTIDFNIPSERAEFLQPDGTLSSGEFAIDRVYRFEGASNPADQSVLYAISSLNGQLKGMLVNGYGLSSDDASERVVSRLGRRG